MKVLCLSETDQHAEKFLQGAELLFFEMPPLEPHEHSLETFEQIFDLLENACDLSTIDLIVAENVDAVPLTYLIRKSGHFCPAIFIPHTNAYPFHLLFYFLLVAELRHPNDCLLCGSMNAVRGYQELLRLDAKPICTFGIQRRYQRKSQKEARKTLGLPLDKKLLLYTGRLMNDKGVKELVELFSLLKQEENVGLVLAVSHIDPDYYNALAPYFEGVTLFYRLADEMMPALYQSCDLFVSLATSIFETYGKSPMEAIACGVPCVLPNWDGFPHYIDEDNGALVRVCYGQENISAPFSFAKVDVNDALEQCRQWLHRSIDPGKTLPDWAYYDHTMKVLQELTTSIVQESSCFFKSFDPDVPISLDRYPPIVGKICRHYGIEMPEDLLKKSGGLLSQKEHGDRVLLQELHDFLFQTMVPDTVPVSG